LTRAFSINYILTTDDGQRKSQYECHVTVWPQNWKTERKLAPWKSDGFICDMSDGLIQCARINPTWIMSKLPVSNPNAIWNEIKDGTGGDAS
jgi:hypothetical protein